MRAFRHADWKSELLFCAVICDFNESPLLRTCATLLIHIHWLPPSDHRHPTRSTIMHVQDPEMVREAQKMMQDPQFQAYMRQMMAQPQFKTAMTQTKEAMKDPEKLKEMEEKAKAAIDEGNKALEEMEAKKKEGKTEETEKEDAKKEGDKEEDDQKEAAKEDEVDDMPDIPQLNIN